MDISNFIEIVQTYTSIRNVSSKEYRNKITKNRTYNEIADIIGRNRSKSIHGMVWYDHTIQGMVIPSSFYISSYDLNIITIEIIVYNVI